MEPAIQSWYPETYILLAAISFKLNHPVLSFIEPLLLSVIITGLQSCNFHVALKILEHFEQLKVVAIASTNWAVSKKTLSLFVPLISNVPYYPPSRLVVVKYQEFFLGTVLSCNYYLLTAFVVTSIHQTMINLVKDCF